MTVSVLAIGDLMLDVLVHSGIALAPDDDIEARIELTPGGQAANVTSWVTHLGGRATLLTPRHTDVIGRLLDEDRAERGVVMAGQPRDGRSGVVVSFTGGGARTMASDPGDREWAECLAGGPELPGHDWVLVSGYVAWRMPDASPLLSVVSRQRELGARIAFDIAAATLVEAYTGDVAGVVRALAPELMLGTRPEWAALGMAPGSFPQAVVKDGAGDVEVWTSGKVVTWPVPPAAGEAVDTTGAGDSFAAGFLVGGIECALATAARCVRMRGAVPPLA